jgi:predicted nucleic acid-binding protein
LARDNVQTLGFDKIEGQAALLACAAATGAANFGDALIAASARSARVQEIYSFDRRFTRAGMIPVLP